MMAKDAAAADTSDREIVITRLLDAPRELVFEVWTDPDQIVQWWGPTGFTTTTHSRDVRVGGAWVFTMHGPDGVDYANKIVYREITPPSRLVYGHGDGGDVEMFVTTVMFANEGGKTRLTMTAVFPTAAMRNEQVEKVGAIEGGNQTIDRLEEYLAKKQG